MTTMDIHDIRDYMPDDRGRVLDMWFGLEKECQSNGGHAWQNKFYDDTLHAWIMDCPKCQTMRIHQTVGNDLRYVNSKDWIRGLVMTDDLDEANKRLTKKDVHEPITRVVKNIIEYVLQLSIFLGEQTLNRQDKN